VLFLLRELLFGTVFRAAVYGAIAIVSGIVITRNLRPDPTR
jgi:hypothetical protein